MAFGACDADDIDTKAVILEPFSNDSPVERTVLDGVLGYRHFLEDGRKTRVEYPASRSFPEVSGRPRYVRLLVLSDLHVMKPEDRKAYARFHSDIRTRGYE